MKEKSQEESAPTFDFVGWALLLLCFAVLQFSDQLLAINIGHSINENYRDALAVVAFTPAIALIVRSSKLWPIRKITFCLCFTFLCTVYFSLALAALSYTDANQTELLRNISSVPITRIAFITLNVAVIEEYIFRGWLLRLLEQRLGALPAVLISSASFVVIHQDQPHLPLIPLSLALAWIAICIRSILIGIIVHFHWNLFFFIKSHIYPSFLPTNNDVLSEKLFFSLQLPALAASAIALAIAVKYLRKL